MRTAMSTCPLRLNTRAATRASALAKIIHSLAYPIIRGTVMLSCRYGVHQRPSEVRLSKDADFGDFGGSAGYDIPENDPKERYLG